MKEMVIEELEKVEVEKLKNLEKLKIKLEKLELKKLKELESQK